MRLATSLRPRRTCHWSEANRSRRIVFGFLPRDHSLAWLLVHGFGSTSRSKSMMEGQSISKQTVNELKQDMARMALDSSTLERLTNATRFIQYIVVLITVIPRMSRLTRGEDAMANRIVDQEATKVTPTGRDLSIGSRDLYILCDMAGGSSLAVHSHCYSVSAPLRGS